MTHRFKRLREFLKNYAESETPRCDFAYKHIADMLMGFKFYWRWRT